MLIWKSIDQYPSTGRTIIHHDGYLGKHLVATLSEYGDRYIIKRYRGKIAGEFHLPGATHKNGKWFDSVEQAKEHMRYEAVYFIVNAGLRLNKDFSNIGEENGKEN